MSGPADKLAEFWNQRYGKEEFAYGTAPNDFLVEYANRIPPHGKARCLADGEGRNGVWLAMQGHAVSSVDIAAEGMAKAQRLAAKQGVALDTQVADLAVFDPGTDAWDGIVSVFMHLPSKLRREVLARCVAALRPGGVVLFEAYAKGQLGRGAGGPPDADLLVALADLEQEFPGCRILHAFCGLRDVNEGRHHTGIGEVVQLVVQKP
ncbi:MAG: class I SAM-dependent methyltransferase [Betaproteobacteria bacterium]|nr:class I SAM-dependent methyltransferase [Betaproteobacteria bacterium]